VIALCRLYSANEYALSVNLWQVSVPTDTARNCSHQSRDESQSTVRDMGHVMERLDLPESDVKSSVWPDKRSAQLPGLHEVQSQTLFAPIADTSAMPLKGVNDTRQFATGE
jgi:hypothetical protein